MISVFSVYGRVHKDLPSFPTRRSSDLEADGREFGDFGVDFIRRHLLAAGEGEFAIAPGAANSPSPAARRCRLDRKSTRLNSSHANISYAVFCLKKKTGNIRHLAVCMDH